jgi:hypothetical protein
MYIMRPFGSVKKKKKGQRARNQETHDLSRTALLKALTK